MKWHEFVKDYLFFTRRERIGILVIAGLMIFVLFLPEISLKFTRNKNIPPDTAWLKAFKKIEIENTDSSKNFTQNENNDDYYTYQYDKSKYSYPDKPRLTGNLFYFDPNTLSETGWKKLGLRNKTILTIQNFLNKGGKFKNPDDLQKIYGLHQDEFARLSPFIKIELPALKNEEKINSVKNQAQNQNIKSYSSHYSIIDINNADTTSYISLPGIGSKLAARIVNFRDKLGGFYSVDQVGETFGLPDSVFQKIKQYLKLENSSIKKININNATVDELKVHPYIKYNLANPIIAYRNMHGPFTRVEDIKKVMVVSEDIFNKISPYLTTQ